MSPISGNVMRPSGRTVTSPVMSASRQKLIPSTSSGPITYSAGTCGAAFAGGGGGGCCCCAGGGTCPKAVATPIITTAHAAASPPENSLVIGTLDNQKNENRRFRPAVPNTPVPRTPSSGAGDCDLMSLVTAAAACVPGAVPLPSDGNAASSTGCTS